MAVATAKTFLPGTSDQYALQFVIQICIKKRMDGPMHGFGVSPDRKEMNNAAATIFANSSGDILSINNSIRAIPRRDWKPFIYPL